MFDPRAGAFGISYFDYASPISEPITKRFISRHRLQKSDPSAAVSEPVQPLVYYLDRGTPEPIRSALLDGARWWNQAFEAAGYRNAFRVEMMPADADLLDIRYNVIQWVHRSTRGWSYGAGVTDPRTGEILKACARSAWPCRSIVNAGMVIASGGDRALWTRMQAVVSRRLHLP